MVRLRRGEGLKVGRLDLPAFLAPEEATLPGYLTLEIALNALGAMAPWKSSNSAASDEPRGTWEGVAGHPA